MDCNDIDLEALRRLIERNEKLVESSRRDMKHIDALLSQGDRQDAAGGPGGNPHQGWSDSTRDDR